MSIRDELNKEFRKFKKVLSLGFALMFLSILMLVAIGHQSNALWRLILFVVGWVLFFVGYLKLWYQVRCPLCRGRLGWLSMISGKGFFKLELLEEYKYCTYCGAYFDSSPEKMKGVKGG